MTTIIGALFVGFVCGFTIATLFFAAGARRRYEENIKLIENVFVMPPLQSHPTTKGE